MKENLGNSPEENPVRFLPHRSHAKLPYATKNHHRTWDSCDATKATQRTGEEVERKDHRG